MFIIDYKRNFFKGYVPTGMDFVFIGQLVTVLFDNSYLWTLGFT